MCRSTGRSDWFRKVSLAFIMHKAFIFSNVEYKTLNKRHSACRKIFKEESVNTKKMSKDKDSFK